MQLRDSVILSGAQIKGKITDQRLKFLTKIVVLKYGNQITNNDFMCDKIKELFGVEVTPARLHVFNMHQLEEEDKKLSYKHVVGI